MSDKERQIIDLKMWVTIALFLLSFAGAVGSYYKTLNKIEAQLSVSLYQHSEKLREEFRREFASKEETRFIQQSLSEIKGELSSINQKLDRRR